MMSWPDHVIFRSSDTFVSTQSLETNVDIFTYREGKTKELSRIITSQLFHMAWILDNELCKATLCSTHNMLPCAPYTIALPRRAYYEPCIYYAAMVLGAQWYLLNMLPSFNINFDMSGCYEVMLGVCVFGHSFVRTYVLPTAVHSYVCLKVLIKVSEWNSFCFILISEINAYQKQIKVISITSEMIWYQFHCGVFDHLWLFHSLNATQFESSNAYNFLICEQKHPVCVGIFLVKTWGTFWYQNNSGLLIFFSILHFQHQWGNACNLCYVTS